MKQNYLILLILLTGWSSMFAQSEPCGQQSTPEQIEYLQTTSLERAHYSKERSPNRNSSAYEWVPVQIFNFRDGAGTYDGFATLQIETMMRLLNESFYDQEIQFFECSHFQTINSNTLFDFDISEEPQLATYDVLNVINIYLFNTVKNGSASYCGYSFLPPSTDKIILSKDFGCAPWNTLVHEVGHYLSLYHTHGKTGNTTDELVNGSNCTTAGDDICDTPADPNLYGQLGSNCVYNSNLQDINMDYYAPDINNFMSYALNDCRTSFSQGQKNRMAYSLANDRSYLNGCSHPGFCETPISTFPVLFDFENSMDGWWYGYNAEYPNLYHQPTSGPSPNPGYGPTSANSGSYYLTFDGAQSTSSDRYFFLNSPCLDLSTMVSPQFTIDYMTTGAMYNEIVVQISTDGGYNWGENTMLYYTGGDQGAIWHTAIIDLTIYANEPIVMLRIAGGLYATEIADISFDNFTISDANTSCQLTGSSSALDVSCNNANDGSADVAITSSFVAPLSYSWSNGGSNSVISNILAGSYNVTVTDGQSCSFVSNVVVNEPSNIITSTQLTNATNGNNNGSILVTTSGGTPSYSYAWSNGSTTSNNTNLAPGNYTLTLTDANGCIYTNSYTIIDQVSCNQTFNSFPYNENFESGLGIFVQEGSDDFDWTQWSGSTPTNGTGPNSAKNGSYYYYTEASGGNSPSKLAQLKTGSCLDLSALNNPIFTTYYHMKGKDIGTFSIEISIDNEQTWTTVFSKTGKQGNGWKFAEIDLIPYKTATTMIRISGLTGNGHKSDMAIDKAFIGENPTPDFAPSSLVSNEDFEMLLFPNPTTNEFVITLNESTTELEVKNLEIYNTLGQIVLVQEDYNLNEIISTNQLKPGNYLVKIATLSGETFIKKLLIIK